MESTQPQKLNAHAKPSIITDLPEISAFSTIPIPNLLAWGSYFQVSWASQPNHWLQAIDAPSVWAGLLLPLSIMWIAVVNLTADCIHRLFDRYPTHGMESLGSSFHVTCRLELYAALYAVVQQAEMTSPCKDASALGKKIAYSSFQWTATRWRSDEGQLRKPSVIIDSLFLVRFPFENTTNHLNSNRAT